MAQPVFQKSFNSGEWAPQLWSRVDMEKYRSGAVLLRNFFVDYRGGASTRTGTKYINQVKDSAHPVRLIPFQASTAVSYMLEFGQNYIRFFYNEAPVLEAPLNITGVTNANPCVVSVANSYAVDDWVYITGVGGMTQLAGYYKVSARTGGTITLSDLNGVAINSTAYGTWTAGGTTARVYTIASPYAGSDLALLKFTQNINFMVLCHPSYATQVLTLVSATNWTLNAAAYGTSASVPTGVAVTTTLLGGSVNYSYIVTSIDALGDESIASAPAALANKEELRGTYGSISISWTAVTGATSYNIYKSDVSYFGVVPSGVPYGFIGNVQGTQLVDSNIDPDFSTTPPIGKNPFTGAPVQSVTQNTAGTYTTVPGVSFTGGTPNASAVATAILGVTGAPTVGAGGTGYVVGDTINLGNGVVVVVATVSSGVITALQPINYAGANLGSLTVGSTPTNPVAQTGTSGVGTGATINLVWGVAQTLVNYGGVGYQSIPTVVYNPTGATATAVLAAASAVNPGVPGFFQQRLVLSGAVSGPETMGFSHPGSYYNFNTSSPIQADDAISVTLASGQLESIKSMIATAPGLIVFTDKSSWLVTGGGLGTAVSPSAIVANRQSFNGANDMPPILNNYDILYVEAKGSAVRDATYNYYAQVFTGQDISVISSHLFYGYQLTEWTWAQAPFKVLWAIRNDGAMITLTFAKEEDFIAWTHQDTAGLFQSVASIPEVLSDGMTVDAVYTVIQRVINGNTIKYVERFADRIYSGMAKNAWCVDAGIQYSGSPASTFSGAQQLAGASVTGLADGVVIPTFIMSTTGTFTLSAPASLVTVGLPFTPQLQTLQIDLGEPTIQGKQKKINAVTVRCADTLGLSIGSDFSHLVTMKDLVVGNVGSQTNTVVTDLVTGDARTFVDPKWAEQGQFCIQQSLPLPATITGVIPQLAVGDTQK